MVVFFNTTQLLKMGLFLFISDRFSLQYQSYKLKKHRWCAWDSHLGPQDGRRKRNHGAISFKRCLQTHTYMYLPSGAPPSNEELPTYTFCASMLLPITQGQLSQDAGKSSSISCSIKNNDKTQKVSIISFYWLIFLLKVDSILTLHYYLIFVRSIDSKLLRISS